MSLCDFGHEDPWPTAYVWLTYGCGHQMNACTSCFLLFRLLLEGDRNMSLRCKHYAVVGKIGDLYFD